VKDPLFLKQAILATLHYFDLFDFAPTLAELEAYLYGWSAPKEPILEAIRTFPNVAHAHGFYCLVGRESIAEERKERTKIAEKLWKRVERFGPLFALCPFVRMVAVCNSLAYDNASAESDIDIFVTTAPNRMNTARFFMKLLTEIFGVRVHHDKVAGRFCQSFFVTEKMLNLAPLAYDFDPHLAYFVATMKPILGAEVFKKFLEENESWTGRYFKRSLAPQTEHMREYPLAGALRWVSEKILNLFGAVSESFFAKFLEKRDLAHKKKFPQSNGIVIRKDIFKFHEHDPRDEIAKQFLQRLEIL
jgi:predicted nucleotidyltransferase